MTYYLLVLYVIHKYTGAPLFYYYGLVHMTFKSPSEYEMRGENCFKIPFYIKGPHCLANNISMSNIINLIMSENGINYSDFKADDVFEITLFVIEIKVPLCCDIIVHTKSLSAYTSSKYSLRGTLKTLENNVWKSKKVNKCWLVSSGFCR